MVYTVDGVNYTRRKKIPITGAGSGAQTDFQIKLTTIWAKAMQADYDDVRFTKADMQTLIDAWLESKVDSTSAEVWVEFPTTPADGVEETEAYMYFGNAGASSDWNIVNTFLYGDDFEDGNIATGGTAAWTQISGTTVESSGVMAFNEASEEVETPSTSAAARWEIEIKGPFTTNSRGVIFRFMWIDSSNYNELYISRSSGGTNYLMLRKIVSGTPANLIVANPTHTTNFHTYKITRDTSGNFEIFRDNVSQGTTTDTAITTSNKIRLLELYGTNTIINFDDLRVSKFVANPPTYVFGSEEHQRRTPMMM